MYDDGYPDPQPAKAVLATRRMTVSGVARALGRSRHYLGRVLNGYEPAPADLRAGLADLLGVEERTLFRPSRTSGTRYPGDDALRPVARR